MRILIVDDEPLARRGVRVCLKKAQDAEIIGECASGEEALPLIEKLQPDLVFLDIQMPGMSGFDVATQIKAEQCPLIIFLTAYDAYALQAFSIHALDYLLKPIHDQRFSEALELAQQRLRDKQARELMQNIRSLVGGQTEHSPQSGHICRIPVKTGTKTIFVDVASIEWIEAAGDYVALHVGSSTHLVRGTLDRMEQQLSPSTFVRIHRSTIVARDQIQHLRTLPTRDATIVLRNGTELRASRRFRARI